MVRVQPDRRLPWVGASLVAPSVWVISYLILRLVQLSGFVSPEARDLTFLGMYSLVIFYVPLGVLLLVGFFFNRRYRSPQKRVFGVCAATSAFAILVILLGFNVWSGGSGISKPALVVLVEILDSAIGGIGAAALITVGAAMNGTQKE